MIMAFSWMWKERLMADDGRVAVLRNMWRFTERKCLKLFEYGRSKLQRTSKINENRVWASRVPREVSMDKDVTGVENGLFPG